MRLFYDIQSPRWPGEILLIASDILMVAAPVFLATAVLERHAPIVEMGLLLVWIAIPRAVARYLAAIEKPREALKLYSWSFVFVILTTGLITIGWHLLSSEDAAAFRVRDRTALLIVLTWSSTFLLFHRHMYRIFDFLCGAMTLMGILDGRPLLWLWVPLFFLGLFFSATTRHILHDFGSPSIRRTVNLQNVRVLALGGTLVAASFFLIVHAIFGGPDFVEHSLDRSQQTRRGLPESGLEPTWEYGEDADSHDANSTSVGAQKTGSYSYKVPVNTVGTRPYDTRTAVTIHLEDPGSQRAWPPPPDALWSAMSMSSFDAVTNEWLERQPIEKHPWPESGDLVIRALQDSGTRPMILANEIEIPVFHSLIRPAGTSSYSASSSESFGLSPALDIFPRPPLAEGSRYTSSVAHISHLQPPEIGPKTVAAHYYTVPTRDALGVDLRALGRRIFRGRTELNNTVNALSDYLRDEEFIYVRRPTSRGPHKLLDDLLNHSRTGNCTHYATLAALLLRTQGIATRFTVGFMGWDPVDDGDRNTIALQLGRMHAWVEIHDNGTWHSYDPTLSVEPRSADELPPPSGGLSDDSPIIVNEEEMESTGEFESLRWTESSPFRSRRNPQRTNRSGNAEADARNYRRRRPHQSFVDNTENTPNHESHEWFSFGEGFHEDSPGAPSPNGEMGSEMSAATMSVAADGTLGPSSAKRVGPREKLRRYAVLLRSLLLAIAVGLGIFLWYTLRRPAPDDEEDEKEEDTDDDGDPSIQQAGMFGIEIDATTPRGRVVLAYHELQSDLGRVRLQRRPYQTPLEHARGLIARFPGLKRPLEVLTATLYGILFASAGVSEKDADDYESHCRRIRRKLS